MNAVDTNVLFYAHDSREAAKRAVPASLIESLDDAVPLWAVAFRGRRLGPADSPRFSTRC